MKKYWTLAVAAPALALLAGCHQNDAANTTAADNSAVDSSGLSADNAAGDNAMLGDNLTDNGMTAAPAVTGQEFADTVAASDAYEIAAGKLAQEKATDPALKQFGAMMVKDHTASTAKLKAAAAKASPAVTPSPALTAEQEAMLKTLRDAKGADFDNAYRTQQIAGHQKALTALQTYQSSGDVASLKQFASDASAVVQSHLKQITGAK